ncbi:MAG: hypothetical protein GY925_17930 [Actinomycetia bacterium]|nr:hypothetical protein [Actinomycetes bacterium]
MPIVDIRYSDGVDTRRNSVVVTYDGGTVSAVDTTAVARDGEIRETVTLPVASESYAQAWADHVVNTRANQTTRVDTVTISAGRDPDNIVRTVLELEIGDRVTVYHTPVDDTGTPDVIEFTGFVERMSWDLGGDRWWLTLTLSPEAFSLADW